MPARLYFLAHTFWCRLNERSQIFWCVALTIKRGSYTTSKLYISVSERRHIRRCILVFGELNRSFAEECIDKENQIHQLAIALATAQQSILSLHKLNQKLMMITAKHQTSDAQKTTFSVPEAVQASLNKAGIPQQTHSRVDTFLVALYDAAGEKAIPESVLGYSDGEAVIEWGEAKLFCTITDDDECIYIINGNESLHIKTYSVDDEISCAKAVEFVLWFSSTSKVQEIG